MGHPIWSQIEFLHQISESLHAEAKRRETINFPDQKLSEVWKPFNKRKPGQLLQIHVFQWIGETVITLLEKGEISRRGYNWDERGYITVYFGSAPDLETKEDRSPKEQRKVERRLRKALRAQTAPLPMSRYKIMVVNPLTRAVTVQEQLAIFFIQLGIADSSVWKFIREHQAQGIAEILIKNYADPSHPGSYGKYVGQLRRANSRESWEQKGSICSTHPMGYTIAQVSRITGIPRSTIYKYIETDQIKACRDKRKTKRISEKAISKLRSIQEMKTAWKLCRYLKEQMASKSATNKWITRRRRENCDPKDLIRKLHKDLHKNVANQRSKE